MVQTNTIQCHRLLTCYNNWNREEFLYTLLSEEHEGWESQQRIDSGKIGTLRKDSVGAASVRKRTQLLYKISKSCEKYIAYVEQQPDTEESAMKRRLEKDSALCVLLGRDCDVVEFVEDGIRCSTLSNGKCILHLSYRYPT
jgi:hypothetical protein